MDETNVERKYFILLLKITALFGCAIICWFILFIIFFPNGKHIEPIPFNNEIWIEEKDKEWKNKIYRYAMVDDLLKNHLKIGIQKSEVISLLGEPDQNYQYDGEQLHFEYDLGRVNLLGIAWLNISFNENEEITEIKVIRD